MRTFILVCRAIPAGQRQEEACSHNISLPLAGISLRPSAGQRTCLIGSVLRLFKVSRSLVGMWRTCRRSALGLTGAESGTDCSQMFAVGGIVLFIASAKMAIDPTSAKVSTKQMKDMQDIIKHQISSQIKTSMKSNIKLQKKDVKTRESDTHEVHSLERQVCTCLQCAVQAGVLAGRVGALMGGPVLSVARWQG